ncbi:MAG: N-acetylneuraminate synthase family protein [Candidatus Micrarchaeota archaeon]|nr:N-acetylneuraminate synthase family protein [Candidatus Micrarchaeota archaeon]
MAKGFLVGKRKVGPGEPAFIIAEVGSNFDGKLEKAKRMVDLAIRCGADAIKFQSFKTEKIINVKAFGSSSDADFQKRWGKPVGEVYKAAEFPRQWHAEVAEYCKKKGIIFFSAPYDKEAVDLLDEIGVPAFKIGSGDVTFLQLVEYIAKKGKPIFMGVGASTMAEIEEAVNTIRKHNDQLLLMQCVTNYPSPFEDANVRAMQTLQQAFDCPVGYSDHTPGSVVPILSVALGGCAIEKHFTDDKALPGPDHPFALDAQEFAQMVRDVRNAEKALGSPVKKIYPSEEKTKIVQRRSIFAARDIKKGTRITAQMLAILRPWHGLLPKYFDVVVGRVAQKNIKAGEPITWDKV